MFSLALPAAAQDCPSATGKGSFVVERGPDSKTEVFAGDGAIVRLILRYRGQTLLETTVHEGLFELERLDRGRRSTLKPKADLAKLFPMKKQRLAVEFDVQQSRQSRWSRSP